MSAQERGQNVSLDARIAFSGAGLYTDFAKTAGYNNSEYALCYPLTLHLYPFQNPDMPVPVVVEVGAGSGQSTLRIEERLRRAGIEKYKLISTELNQDQILEGIKGNTEAQRKGESPIARVPDVLAAAEKLWFPDESVHVVYGSQVIHWVNNPQDAIKESFRVLKPGGLTIFASSGWLGGFPPRFNELPIYKRYMKELEKILIRRGFWKKSDGEFTIRNPVVNPFFQRYTWQNIARMMAEEGFEIEVRHHEHLVDRNDMVSRIGAGAATMNFFSGEYARDIPKEEKEKIVNEAVRKILKNRKTAAMLGELDRKPGLESTPVFIGRKPIPQQAA